MGIFSRLIKREQRPHIVEYGDNLRVWIFAQPLNAAAQAMWDKMDFIPPKTLIQSADEQMELGGTLVSAVSDNFVIDKLPRMTKEQRSARITKEAGDSAWMCSALETELIRYNVVVITKSSKVDILPDFDISDESEMLGAMINAAANIESYKKSGWIDFIRKEGQIIGIWTKDFPRNTPRKVFLCMYLGSEKPVKDVAAALTAKIMNGDYTIAKAKNREGFNVFFI